MDFFFLYPEANRSYLILDIGWWKIDKINEAKTIIIDEEHSGGYSGFCILLGIFQWNASKERRQKKNTQFSEWMKIQMDFFSQKFPYFICILMMKTHILHPCIRMKSHNISNIWIGQHLRAHFHVSLIIWSIFAYQNIHKIKHAHTYQPTIGRYQHNQP